VAKRLLEALAVPFKKSRRVESSSLGSPVASFKAHNFFDLPTDEVPEISRTRLML
jgi:hypothetical protein